MKRSNWLTGLGLAAAAVLALALAPIAGIPAAAAGETGSSAMVAAVTLQKQADTLQRQGNYREAYVILEKLALDPKTPPAMAAYELETASYCLQNLGNIAGQEALIEAVVKVHAQDREVLQKAAGIYRHLDHGGTMVDGKFERGPHRGGTAKYVDSLERDRVRSLQLMQQAMPLLNQRDDHHWFYHEFADTLMGDGVDAWRLQALTDLTTLPDYDDVESAESSRMSGLFGGGRHSGFHGGATRGAPVDAAGRPVFFAVPKSWESAQNDGERWRWLLSKMSQNYAEPLWAQFLQTQFGVQTLAPSGWRMAGNFGEADKGDDTRQDESGVYAVHTLKENETIARLATGIKRLILPDDCNFLAIYKRLASQTGYNAMQAARALAQEFENRRQYDRAAEFWKRLQELTRTNKKDEPWKTAQQHLDQILKNQGQFEPVMTQPAGGQGATVDYRFRNGTKVHFDAVEINVSKLLAGVKAYLKSDPYKLDWRKTDIQDLGYRLVEKNQTQYLGRTAAQWDLALTPRAGHWDRRTTVQTPLRKAGAYLVTAKLADGNVSRIILWIADTAIVEKNGDGKQLYFVCDAVTGRPLKGITLDFFGYRRDQVKNLIGHGLHDDIKTQEFTALTDDSGRYNLNPDKRTGYNWLVTATDANGRLAYLGFIGVWCNRYHDVAFSQSREFVMTDRPVYRPGQKVQFRIWADQAHYEREGKSPYAGKFLAVKICNPKGEKIFGTSLQADQYGGAGGEFELPKNTALGMYRLGSQGTFRVEEYKKPEYEVTVEAPAEPVMLGEKITAVIKAKYYFGAPVTDALVKYRIQRTAYSANWYPASRWDWYYGPGYWWFAYDCAWYPGWRDWGCRRPVWEWCPWWQRPAPPPEIVTEGEARIGQDGTLKLLIDSEVAKALHGDTDHKYEITAEVTDKSRRVITGQGTVLAARKPFKVYAWVDRGHYRTGDVVQALFKAQTLDGRPVAGEGKLNLFLTGYDKDGKPVETLAGKWTLPTDAQGEASLQITAARPGQYRLSHTVTDVRGHVIEGGYLFSIMGEKMPAADYRFNDIEIVPDKKEYAPGEPVKLRLNAARPDSTVLFFVKPAQGVYLEPQVLRLTGKSMELTLPVEKRDMPNFFLEAVTVADGKVYTDVREIVVPPEKKVLNVTVTPAKTSFKPGEQGTLTIKVTDPAGRPVTGQAALTLYDKSVEYISGGSNIPDIRDFFWKWRRTHQAGHATSLDKGCGNLIKSKEPRMQATGIFGGGADEESLTLSREDSLQLRASISNPSCLEDCQVNAVAPTADAKKATASRSQSPAAEAGSQPVMVQPAVRSNFADTALWRGALELDARGEARVEVTMPENLTTWKAKSWVLSDACRVGEGTAEMVTTKNLIVRLQAPRFFVQKDEVVLSAVVHNYLKTRKQARVVLEIAGGGLEPLGCALQQTVAVEANGEARVDWRMKVLKPGEARIRMSALTDEESDAMEQTFPACIHGMLKTESFSRMLRPETGSATIALRVPQERLPEQSRLEVRFSPTLAGTMVDALPYLSGYPYGCTEQTLNRFLPTVITQKVLLDMGLDLKDIQKKRTNLNAQEIGNDAQRMTDWKRTAREYWMTEKNPVFDIAAVRDMVQAGVDRLAGMQCSDGGWGWFSGDGEQSYPHTTAVVVHGLQIARECDALIPPAMLDRGIGWLKRYQAEELRRLKLPIRNSRNKLSADSLDALVCMVLTDARADSKEMREFLYRDRNGLPVSAKAMLAIACHQAGDTEKRDMLRRNIEQYLVRDPENQTAYLKLPENNSWWCWYGSEYETQAYYLRLLAAVEPKSDVAPELVKYLVNNRRHATYWNSTRDTAMVIEAFAAYIKATGEDAPDLTVQLVLDGKVEKEVTINRGNLFSFDNKLVLEGAAISTGNHALELRKTGKGPLYANAYLTNFTLEDPITKAGLEIKVARQFYKLVPVQKTIKVEGVRGQALDQKVEKYVRQRLPTLFEPWSGIVPQIRSGDLIEVELTIESKNDYEYLLFEDMKPAGCEPVEVRSGYNGNDLGAYVEFRDERVAFFVRQLARGTHSVSYRLRAEIPGAFSALPAKGSAMYAPELKANSDEMKITVQDAP